MSLCEAWWLQDGSVAWGSHRPEMRRQLSSPDDRLILLERFSSNAQFKRRVEELLSSETWEPHVIACARDLMLDTYPNGLRVHDKIELIVDFVDLPGTAFILPKGTFLEVAPGYTHFPNALYADTRKWPPYRGRDRHLKAVILDCSGLGTQYRKCARSYNENER